MAAMMVCEISFRGNVRGGANSVASGSIREDFTRPTPISLIPIEMPAAAHSRDSANADSRRMLQFREERSVKDAVLEVLDDLNPAFENGLLDHLPERVHNVGILARFPAERFFFQSENCEWIEVDIANGFP